MPKVCCGPCLTLGEVVMSASGRDLPSDARWGTSAKGQEPDLRRSGAERQVSAMSEPNWSAPSTLVVARRLQSNRSDATTGASRLTQVAHS